MIQIEKLSYQYPNQTSIEFQDFHLEDASPLLITGQSGSGKTTLLHLLAGILKLQHGEIKLNQIALSNLSDKEMDKFRGSEIGIIFQTPHFIKSLSVEENLIAANYFSGNSLNKSKALAIAERLNITSKLSKRTNNLSQGEKQRVSIARAVMNEPSIILADEPTSSLDDTNTEQVLNLLKSEAEKINAHLIVVTHDNRLIPHFENRLQV